MAKRAIIYCRTATAKQNGENNSLERQSKDCYQYAKKKGYLVVEEIKECGNDNEINKGLKNAINEVISNRADVLIATNIDRISRNSWKVMEVANKLNRRIEFSSFDISGDDAKAILEFDIMLCLNAFNNRLHKTRCRCGIPIRQKTTQP